MANRDDNTSILPALNVVQPINIGHPIYIRDDQLEKAALILRCLIAIGDEGIDHLADEPYEVLVRVLDGYKRNISELATSAKEVVYRP